MVRPDAPARIPRRVRVGVLGVLAVLFLAVGLHQAGRDAPTVDEGVDISSGVASLVHRDLRMVPEHPALPKAVAALPALLAHPIVPKTAAWHRGDWFDWSDDFISANEDAGRLHDVLLYARAVVLLEALAVGALLHALTKRWFGADGAFLVAVVWLTTPYVVGLSHVAMIDLPFTLAVCGVALLLARWSDAPTTGRTVALGAGLAAALASRHTALVLVALVVGVMVHARRAAPRDAAREVGLVGLVSVLGLWLVYRVLSPGGPPPGIAASFHGAIDQGGADSAVVKLVGALPLPLEWRAGFAYLDLTSTARPSSLLGQSWDGGVWWYFPVSALLKLPLTLTAAVVAGWVAAIRHGRARRELARVVVLPALVLWLFLVAQPLNLGLRLALPTVALALVGLGALPGAIERLGARSEGGGALGRAALAGVAVVLVVQLVASAVAVPHSLAWTPPPWTPAYRWVSDANLDAGQALYEVRAWSRRHDHPYVALDRTRGLQVEGGSRALLDVEPSAVRGWVAVGVTPLMQTRRDDTVWSGEPGDLPPGFSLAWLRKYCPVGTLAGGSVLVYRFDGAPDPAPGPERPVGPCFGASYSSAG